MYTRYRAHIDVKYLASSMVFRGGSRKLWVRGRVCVSQGKALDRGTKCRAGGGGGREGGGEGGGVWEGGVSPPYVEAN